MTLFNLCVKYSQTHYYLVSLVSLKFRGSSYKLVYIVLFGETMNSRLLAILAVGIALAVVLASSAVLVYAKSAEGERGIQRGIAAGLNIRHRLGPRIEVSEEYKKKVIDIATKDSDVAKLLEEGYNITAVRPIIKLYVGGDGTVTLRADEAVVVLRKNRDIALVLVNVREERVTKILIRNTTVIEK